MGRRQHNCHCEERCEDTFVSILSGGQEVPVVKTSARGVVKARLRKNKLTVCGFFKNLESSFDTNIGSHIHLEYAGRNGEIVFTLVPTLSYNKKSGCFKKHKNTFELTDEQVRDLKDRKYYINIHTLNTPSGELRGQLLPRAYKYYLVNLSGANEVPPVETDASGTLVVELHKRNLTLSGSFNNLSSPIAIELLGGAHIHQAPKGLNGPVVFTLGLDPDNNNLSAVLKAERNVYALTCKQEKVLRKKNFYVNIHSENYPSGELRGQILPVSKCGC